MNPIMIAFKTNGVKQERKKKEEAPTQHMNEDDDKQIYPVCLFETKHRIKQPVYRVLHLVLIWRANLIDLSATYCW